jgi:hypothetical protein
MRSGKHPAKLGPSTVLELAVHTAMGAALGLGFSLALLFFDAFKIATLIAQSVDPHSSMIVFAGTFTLAFAVGATLTGFVLIMMGREKHS